VSLIFVFVDSDGRRRLYCVTLVLQLVALLLVLFKQLVLLYQILLHTGICENITDSYYTYVRTFQIRITYM
jgi:hypothetical protein